MTTIYCPTRVTVGHKLHMQFVAKIAVAILVLERLFTEYTSHYASYLLIRTVLRSTEQSQTFNHTEARWSC